MIDAKDGGFVFGLLSARAVLNQEHVKPQGVAAAESLTLQIQIQSGRSRGLVALVHRQIKSVRTAAARMRGWRQGRQIADTPGGVVVGEHNIVIRGSTPGCGK